MSHTEIVWLVIGFTGQAMFGMRFVVQWIASERNKRSFIPIAFWGGCTLLSYAIYKRDPVFIMGQSIGLFIYLRNLYFVYRERQTHIEDSKNHFKRD